MALKVNLKKYLPLDGKWQFFPVLKVDGKPRPEAVMISGAAVKGTSGTFYLEYRQDGRRIQRPCGVTSREALDAWRTQVAILSGAIEAPPEESEPLPTELLSMESAVQTYLTEVKGTKSAGTLDAYTSDLAWFKNRIKRSTVGKVTRSDIMGLFAKGREEGLAQASINRRIMVGIMALRNAGSDLKLKKGDWPKVAEEEVEIYEPEDIKAFFAACAAEERLIFQTFLSTGFRARELSTLTWDSVNWKRNTLGVKERPAFRFIPKNYEVRTVPVPASLMAKLKEHNKGATGTLVFPTPPHPKRLNYGGDQPNAHHLEMCKAVAHRARLNCGRCVTPKGKCLTSAHCEKWYLHRWRHTYATGLLQSNFDVRSVQVLLGHKNIATTEKYLKSLRIGDLNQKIEASSLAALVL